MGDKVKELVSGYIGELEGEGGKRVSKPVTFSMRLSERDHARLVRLSENLGVPKTPLAEGLLKAAVEEAIGQYAGWASPEDPEGFVEEAFGGGGGTERDPEGATRGGRPPGPGHRPPGPGHHPPKPGHGPPPPKPGHGPGHGPPPPRP